MRDILLNSHFQLSKRRLRDVSNLSEGTGLFSVNGSGYHAWAMERRIVVGRVDSAYPHNFPNMAWTGGMDDGEERCPAFLAVGFNLGTLHWS